MHLPFPGDLMIVGKEKPVGSNVKKYVEKYLTRYKMTSKEDKSATVSIKYGDN